MKSKRVDRGLIVETTADDSPTDNPSTKRQNVREAAAEEEPMAEGDESSELRLLGLLLQCAECVAMDNFDDATELLPEISELSSPFGSSPERVAIVSLKSRDGDAINRVKSTTLFYKRCSSFFGFQSKDRKYTLWRGSYRSHRIGVSAIDGRRGKDKKQVIGINENFPSPGPILNVITNLNVIINVKNDLDEPLLLTWNGIQNRKNSWQDGVFRTNCPIPAGWNWTYQFQVKDQIGSFFYFPSTNFQRAFGGYGGFIINNRDIIPLPFGLPDGDITLLISDWYKKSHKELRKHVEKEGDLGVPDGILVNGFGPYRYDEKLVPGGISYQIMNVEPGKTYHFRVHNVGISTSLNFRIQNHNLLLVETKGSVTVQQNYTDMDIHVGQSYSFFVTMDQNASSDYYIVGSPRNSSWTKACGVSTLHYSNSLGPASGPLPDPPNESDTYYSMTQARSIRLYLHVMY